MNLALSRFFVKTSAHSVVGPNEAVRLPPFSKKVDWEAEIGVVIGRAKRDLPVERAFEAVAGYTIVNDLSARDFIKREGSPFVFDWVGQKCFDGSAPMGPWITPALAPWRFEGAGFDPVSSIGARLPAAKGGDVIGWVINHVVAPGTVRFTCSFLRKDVSRRGRIVPLYHESLQRLAAAGVERATFVTPVLYPNMIRFILRWIAPIADFVGETRGSAKRLGRAKTASAAIDGNGAES